MGGEDLPPCQMDLQWFAQPSSAQERTEEATPHKRQEAARKGQVARSPELPGNAALIAVAVALGASGPALVGNWLSLGSHTFASLNAAELSIPAVRDLFIAWSMAAVRMAAPLLLAGTLAAVVVALVQGGLRLSPMPGVSALNPVTGFKRMFSLRSLVELGRALLKVLLVVVIVWISARGEGQQVISLNDVPVISAWTWGLDFGRRVLLRAAIALALVGVLDYMYRRWQLGRELRMTKQEIKEESKQTEGRPEVRQRIRSRQREMARRRMMADVPKADVVLMNPTHYAVALRYDAASMSAPTVVAKGQDLLALRIRSVAEEHGVPVVENPPLTRSLYAAVDLGRTISSELYQAVAEVLAYVYKLKGK